MASYTKKEIVEKSDEKLLSAFYWIAVRVTNEVNSKRGLTKGTQKDEQAILAEMVKRFNLDEDTLKELIFK